MQTGQDLPAGTTSLNATLVISVFPEVIIVMVSLIALTNRMRLDAVSTKLFSSSSSILFSSLRSLSHFVSSLSPLLSFPLPFFFLSLSPSSIPNKHTETPGEICLTFLIKYSTRYYNIPSSSSPNPNSLSSYTPSPSSFFALPGETWRVSHPSLSLSIPSGSSVLLAFLFLLFFHSHSRREVYLLSFFSDSLLSFLFDHPFCVMNV